MSRTRPLVAPALALLAVLSATALGAQQPAPAPALTVRRAFVPSDVYRIATLADPVISPDGQLVAFTVTTIREHENKRHSEIWVVPTAGGAPMRYTSSSAESSAPRFSPDGRYLLFTSHRTGDKSTDKVSRWALRVDRPAGEAFPADSLPRATTFTADHRLGAWADTVETAQAVPPRDSALQPRDPYAGMGALARPPFAAITHPLDPKRFDGRQFTDMVFKSNDRGYVPSRAQRRTYPAAQLWIQGWDGTPRRMLTHTLYSHRDAVISPDGRWIAFLADPMLRPDSVVLAEHDSLARLPYDSARDERPRDDADIFVVPASGEGAPRRVTRFTGEKRALAWSPDSRTISFIGAPTRTTSLRIYTVPVTATEDAAPHNALGTWTYEPQEYQWVSPNEIMMSTAVGGRTGIFAVTPSSAQVRELVGGRRQLRGWDVDAAHDRLAFVSTDMTHPTELWLGAGGEAAGHDEGKRAPSPRRVTGFNDALLSQVAFSDAERFTYPSVGLEIEGWLMRPYGYQPGKKYPLVLYIHGGPHSSYGEGWFDEFQNLAGAGMFVLFTNPRGSSGYGAPFTYSTRGRWGAEDYTDLMKAVDIAAARPDVDSTRMGVTGGSYGGFMTAWITTKTNRFKAAEVDRMISDWTYWYGASDAQGLTEWEFYGKPWDNFAMYDSLAPIRHVTHVRTPTLLVQSEEDFRAPMGNAELWYTALRKQGVPAELVRYPRSTHELSRSGEPWLLVDRLARLRQWFTYWLVTAPTRPGGATVARSAP